MPSGIHLCLVYSFPHLLAYFIYSTICRIMSCLARTNVTFVIQSSMIIPSDRQLAPLPSLLPSEMTSHAVTSHGMMRELFSSSPMHVSDHPLLAYSSRLDVGIWEEAGWETAAQPRRTSERSVPEDGNWAFVLLFQLLFPLGLEQF